MMLRIVLAFGLVVGIAACSRITVETSAAPDWSPSGWRTYRWRPVPGGSLGDPRVNEEYLVKVIRRQADAELAAKGYAKVSDGQPDFEVGHWLALRMYDVGGPTGDTTSWESSDRPPGYWEARGTVPAAHVEKGSIGIYLVDPQADKNVWRGEARAAVNFKADREKRKARVEDAVRRILADLPAVSQ